MPYRQALLALLALPIVAVLLRAPPKPSRETVVAPADERVVLLGASSGVGKDLALAYAKRGARILIVARRAEALQAVADECAALGLDKSRILIVPADITSVDDVIKIRETAEKAWGGIDTLHILAGVPSTRTLLQLSGVDLVADPQDKSPKPRLVPQAIGDSSLAPASLPTKAGLENAVKELRALNEINIVGTVLSLAAFLPLLSSSSKSPAVHHLSSVSAAIPAPMRCLYSATKAGAYMAFETARVECEGSGVRFFSLLPGTIDNEFRTKTAFAQTGGNCEVHNRVNGGWGDKLLLPPRKVVDTVLQSLALSPEPAPLIPYPPFSWLGKLKVPPASTVFLPWQYGAASILQRTPLGYLFVEPNARKKYGMRP
ncbi:11-beta-hydroxysteroid dehydrogenase-like 3 [Vanrija pseudolonga]|uniref:11-beta-hydroxysteroid dehydrogenase-like 3 n=1 Tax=Vanrija pseudolonga TaxID=143232 RepID=A0AAF0Y365_9TREE|nr:11-beta-hydroxysteroid dehydrogenase-like 3 [Vanrija pseudolonga]